MHLTRHVVAGGALPESMDESERVRVMGPSTAHGPAAAAATPAFNRGPPLVIVVESFANIKDGQKLKNANVSVVLVDGGATAVSVAATTPMGSGARSGGSNRLQRRRWTRRPTRYPAAAPRAGAQALQGEG